MSELQFVVRPLKINGTQGAFRVHISVDALSKIGLNVGDTCSITSENGGSSGLAIAWRAAEGMGNSPKIQGAKLSETLRETFGFKEGTKVAITKTDKKIMIADKIALTDVTPAEYDGTDDGCWMSRTRGLLVGLEVFAVGMTFDVVASKGLKKRFFIERIDSRGAIFGSPGLFTQNDKTEYSLLEEPLRSPASSTPSTFQFGFESDLLGGLTDQVKILDEHLRNLCIMARREDHSEDPTENYGVILHGYEGTGKTLLLNELERRSGVRKVIRLRRRDLLGTSTKNAAVTQEAFQSALDHQPSLLLIDDLERIAAAGDLALTSTVNALVDGLKSISGMSVLAISAARDLGSVDSSLLTPECFPMKIELPVPDAAARAQILKVLVPTKEAEEISQKIGSQTHGYTGRDLQMLVTHAKYRARKRRNEDQEGWIKVHPRSATEQESLDTLVDGKTSSHPPATAEQNVPSHSRVNLEDFETALPLVRPTAMREIILETPSVTWNDIGGSDKVKDRFDELIGWPLHHPEMLATSGFKSWQKGALLYGPPGCSKTMTAQAVANTYGLNFIAVKGAELLSMYVGESERAVREIFRKAKAAAPSIIFFDEIDAIGTSRDTGGQQGLHVLTTLLNEMDGFEQLKGVIVLAATNRPDSLDPALLRPGRFDEHVYLGLPPVSARLEIIEMRTKIVPLAEDVDAKELAERTSGYSGAEVVSICEAALICRVRRMIKGGGGQEALLNSDFDEALEKVRKGITQSMLDAYTAFATRGDR